MMSIGDKVKTNDYYLNCGYTSKRRPINSGTVTAIEYIDNHTIVHVKTEKGMKRSFNQRFMEVL